MSREKKQSFMGGVTIMAISTIFVKICGSQDLNKRSEDVRHPLDSVIS